MKLPKEIVNDLMKQPETGMGYQTVIWQMKSGGICISTVYNCEEYDETEVAGIINFNNVTNFKVIN